jgi:hypothetical protein
VAPKTILCDTLSAKTPLAAPIMELGTLNSRAVITWTLAGLVVVVALCIGYCLQLVLPVVVVLTGLEVWWRNLPIWIPLVIQNVVVLTWFALSVYLLRFLSKKRPIQPLRLAGVIGLTVGTFIPVAIVCLMLLLVGVSFVWTGIARLLAG